MKEAGFRLIVIDTPPAMASVITEIVSHADLVIIPTHPNLHHLRAVGLTADIVEHQRKPLIFVVNAATASTQITTEMVIALSQHGPIAPVFLPHNVGFAPGMIEGRTAGRTYVAARAAREIALLWDYLGNRLRRMRTDATVLANRRRQTVELDGLAPFTAPQPASAGPRHPAMLALQTANEHPHADGQTDWAQHSAVALSLQTSAACRAMYPELTVGEPGEAPDGCERRKENVGPPPGLAERRKARQAFGRRGLDLPPPRR